MGLFSITVKNTRNFNSHNINIERPTYYAEASNKYEAVGKMVLSDWKYKEFPIIRIEGK